MKGQIRYRGLAPLLHWGAMALLCLAAAAERAHAAEQWECRFLLSDRGVQFPEVREFVEDRQGRIWASSWGNGVACIQETSWKTYTEKDGLASDWVRGLALGSDGTVWISTPKGMCYVRGDTLHCIAPSALPLLAGDEPDLLLMTQGGDLILSTFDGALYRIRGVSAQASLLWGEPERWQVLLPRDAPDAVRVADFEEDVSGQITISFKDDSWAALSESLLARTPGPGGTMYLTSCPGGDGAPSLWAASSGKGEATTGLFRYESGVMALRHTLPDSMRGLASGPDGWCYAGTTAGLYRFNEGSVARVDLGHQVGFPDINEVFFASDGSLWLGAREGLVRGAPHAWKHYPATAEHHNLIALLHDPASPGQLLGVDDNFCLARLENDTWTETVRLEVPEALRNFTAFGTQPTVWAMGSNTLYQFDRMDGSLSGSFPVPPTGADRKLFMTSTGELWLAAKDGVYGLANGTWEERPRSSGYKRRPIYSFYEPSPGVFYVGASDGIERWEGDEVTYFGEGAGVSEDDAAYTICPAANGDLWFGTFGSGVYRFDGTSFEHFDDTRGLAHHSVSNILQTADGTLWLSYRRVGIASYRESRWLNFGYENGLTNSPIDQLIEDDGGLWLVTRKEGFYQYRPDTQAPETFITAATGFVARGGIGVFSFRAVDAWQRTPAQSLLYSWRVLDEGRGTEAQPWNNFSSQTSFITGILSPGSYRFEVRASDDARNVDATPAAVSFSVAAPLWREPRVYLPAGAMALLLAVALVMRLRSHRALRRSEAALYESNQQLMSEIRERLQAEQRLTDHFEQLEDLVRGRTEELEAAQRALMEQERLATLGKVTASVSHELRNPLGTLRSTLFTIGRKVQNLDLGLDDALARGERSIQRCDRIIEEFLDFTRTVAMERERVAMDTWLADVLREMQLPASLHCEFEFKSGISLEVDPERLRRAVVNVVNNAVQAMDERESDYNRLRVKSRVRGIRYEIVVNDNGPGMSQESLGRIFEPLYSTKGFGVGLGVPIVNGIMVKHRGGVEYHSVLGQGTTVVLWIPREGLVAGGVLEREDQASGEYGHADEKADNEKDDAEEV